MRLVLMHLPERDQVLVKVADAVKPGGVAPVEEFDSFSLVPMNTPDSCEKLLNTTAAFRQFMASKGVDLGYGRGLGSLLLKCGFKMSEPKALFRYGLAGLQAPGSSSRLEQSRWRGGRPEYFGSLKNIVVAEEGVLYDDNAHRADAGRTDPPQLRRNNDLRLHSSS